MPTARTVDAAGTSISFREQGEGSPVVLLHGFPQTGRCWDEVASALSAEHRVLAPDLPGYGRSARPASFDARTLGDTIAAFMEATGAPRAAVVGHDWGGAVAFRLALDHPDRVERLCVINSPFRKMDFRRGWHMLLFNVPILPEILFTVFGDRAIDVALRAPAANKDAFTPEALAEYHEAYRSLERKRAAFAYYRTVTRQTLLRSLPGRAKPAGPARRVEAPTLVIWGARDPVLPPSLADGIARDIPHARIEMIEDAGHFVPEERPDRVAELLKEFLA